MEPTIIAIICATAFGVATGIVAFIRHLLLSRDKDLNDFAQQKALVRESEELEKIRNQMVENKRLDSHYQMLGSNKDAIQFIEQKIDEVLAKKYALIERYSKIALEESAAIVNGEFPPGRKEICDKLRAEVDSEMQFYLTELQQLQARRAVLWDAHSGLQEHIISEERLRNNHLDALYERHTGVLEKVYLRHNENSEAIAKHSIDASSMAFKAAVTAPLQAILEFFKISTSIAIDVSKLEAQKREDILNLEEGLNAKVADETHDLVKKATLALGGLRRNDAAPAM